MDEHSTSTIIDHAMKCHNVKPSTYWRNCPITCKLTKDWPDHQYSSNKYIAFNAADKFAQYLKEYEKNPSAANNIIRRKV